MQRASSHPNLPPNSPHGERRKELRLAPSTPVQATVLGGTQAPIPGKVIDMSRRGISLELAQEIGSDASLQVEVGDTLLLGEVRYCRQEGEVYRVGMTIRHTLTNLAQLRAWNRQLESLTASPEMVRL